MRIGHPSARKGGLSLNPIRFVLAAFVLAAALRAPTALAAGVELDAADQAKYREAADLIQTWPGYGDQLERAYVILADIGKRNPRSAHAMAGVAEIKYRLYGYQRVPAGDVVRLAQGAIRMDPDNADAQVVYAKIMLDEGHEGEAQQAARRAIELAPDKPEALYVMARVERQFHRYDQAEALYLKAIDRLDNRQRKANVTVQLAAMMGEREPLDVEKTVAVYERAAELAGNDVAILNDAALFLTTHTERYDEAIDMLRKALRISDFAIGRENLGRALYYKWGHATLHPDKYSDVKERPWEPDRITRETGLSKESAFASNPEVDGPPYALLAMLKLGMIKDVNVFPENCECPNNALLAASQNNHPDTVRTLVEHGANVNIADHKYGSTPLRYAVRAQNPAMVEYLLQHGARVNVEDKRGTLILEYAIVDAKANDVRVLKLLLENGGDAQAVSRRGSPLIAVAVLRTNPAAVALLLQHYQADPNARIAGEQSEPVLARAALASHEDGTRVVKLLLDAGANPWVKVGGVDVVSQLEGTKEAFRPMPDQPPNIRAGNKRIQREADKTMAMLREARKKIPKPAGF